MAKFNFLNLDSETRGLMLSEIENDINDENLYTSERLNEVGQENYESYLIKFVKSGDEEILEELLDINSHFSAIYLRQDNPVKMPSNASKLYKPAR